MAAVFSKTAKALKQLSSSDPEQQFSGLQLLQEKAREDTASLLSKRLECVSATVKLLRSSDSQVRRAAASFLACLAAHGAREKVCAEPGAVEGLVGLLGDSSAGVRLEAVHTLAVLLLLGDGSATGIDSTLQDRIGSMPSALSALVPLLAISSSNPQLRLEIAGKVAAQIDNVGKVVDAVTNGRMRGAVGKLTAGLQDKIAGLGLADMLPHGSADTPEAAARLIACLAHNHPANQASITAVPGAVGALLGLLRSSHAGTQLAGTNALIAVSEGK